MLCATDAPYGRRKKTYRFSRRPIAFIDIGTIITVYCTRLQELLRIIFQQTEDIRQFFKYSGLLQSLLSIVVT